MKEFRYFLTVLLVAGSTQAGSYEQNFNSAADGSTNLGAGTTITNNGTGVTQVYDYGSWKALRLTQDGTGYTVGTFAINDLDVGSTIAGFTATFDMLIKNDSGGPADGFSFNFGTLGSLTSGGETGIDRAGNMLSIGWDTYDNGDDPQSIEVFTNGVSVFNSTVKAPVVATSLGAAFQSVSIVWDENGLDLTYGGTVIFTDLDVSGFIPQSGAQFAFTARTGGSDEDVFIDNIDIQTVPEPVSLSLAGLIAGSAWFIRRRFCD
jgi:hypothetical protein